MSRFVANSVSVYPTRFRLLQAEKKAPLCVDMALSLNLFTSSQLFILYILKLISQESVNCFVCGLFQDISKNSLVLGQRSNTKHCIHLPYWLNKLGRVYSTVSWLVIQHTSIYLFLPNIFKLLFFGDERCFQLVSGSHDYFYQGPKWPPVSLNQERLVRILLVSVQPL